MNALVFLLVALVLSLLGSLVLWWKARKPRSLRSSIDAFHREMDALSPDRGTEPYRRER